MILLCYIAILLFVKGNGKVIENISRLLEYYEYKRIDTNVNGVGIYFLERDNIAFIVVINDFISKEAFTKDQYQNVLSQIKRQFLQRGHLKVRLLSLICSTGIDGLKEYCDEGDTSHWIIDQQNQRLIIYENQDADFLGLKKQLDDILVGNNQKEYKNNTNHEKPSFNETQKRAYGRGKSAFGALKGFGLPYVTVVIIIVNCLIFFGVELSGFYDAIMNFGALYYPDVFDQKEYYRLLSHMFLHADSGHLFNNMLVLFFIGERLEKIVGIKKYLFIYLGAGFLAGIGSMSYNMIQGADVSSVGASGAIFGIVGAMTYIVLVNRGRISDITPTRILLFVFLSLYSGFSSSTVDNTAHIVGFLAGIVIAVILYRRNRKSYWDSI